MQAPTPGPAETQAIPLTAIQPALDAPTIAIATEATRAADSYRQLALAAKYATLSLVGLAVALWLSWQLALLTVIGWGFVALGLSRFNVNIDEDGEIFVDLSRLNLGPDYDPDDVPLLPPQS